MKPIDRYLALKLIDHESELFLLGLTATNMLLDESIRCHQEGDRDQARRASRAAGVVMQRLSGRTDLVLQALEDELGFGGGDF